MKKKLILFLLTIFLSSQTNAAESYQRWIYWVNEPSHQVTASEMADITAVLYEGKILSNREYMLSTGVTYKIPQPNLFLEYIEKAVRLARPSADTPKKVIDAIYGAEKMRWDNNVSVRVKNYYFSTLHNKIQWINNYSGENKGTDFLFIDGSPTIKCDCGNPLGIYYEGYIPQYTKPELKSEPLVFSTKKEEDWSFSSPRKIYEERVVDLNLFKIKEKERVKFFQRKIVKVGGGLLATGLIGWGGYELWDYIHNIDHDVPIIIEPIEPRTMPPGIPSIPTTPTVPIPTVPGIPSDPRTMPGGIGFSVNFHF